MPSSWKHTGPLDHLLRKEILEVATRCPGLAIVDLARRLKVHRSTVSHHLRVLEAEGIVTMVRVGRSCLVHPVPAAFRDNGDEVRQSVPKDLAKGLNHHVRRALVRFFSRHGPACYYKYVAWALATKRRRLLVARDTFRHHCNRLKKAGWLESDRESRRTVWRLRSEVRGWVQNMDTVLLEEPESTPTGGREGSQ